MPPNLFTKASTSLHLPTSLQHPHFLSIFSAFHHMAFLFPCTCQVQVSFESSAPLSAYNFFPQIFVWLTLCHSALNSAALPSYSPRESSQSFLLPLSLSLPGIFLFTLRSSCLASSTYSRRHWDLGYFFLARCSELKCLHIAGF